MRTYLLGRRRDAHCIENTVAGSSQAQHVAVEAGLDPVVHAVAPSTSLAIQIALQRPALNGFVTPVQSESVVLPSGERTRVAHCKVL